LLYFQTMITPKSGTLLIADPFLKDTNFKRAVIFLCEHMDEGSFGLVLNKQLNITLGEVIEGLEGNPTKIYFGGPVDMDTIHFLHQLPDEIPGSYKVTDGVYWGGDFELLTKLIKENRIDMSKVRFYLGYSGWQEGQLSNEMKSHHSWLTVAANDTLVFHKNTNQIWGDALSELGADYEPLKNYPIDPQLN
jgi:putative transcriptional regulator